MRIKVECSPPLPSLKVWFVVPAVSTIAELKYALWTELPGLHQSSTDDLTLLLDGFELIDSSSIDAIRDDELITVKQALVNSNKRKIAEEASLPSSKRARRAVEPQATAPIQTTNKHPIQKANAPTAQPSSSYSSSDSESDSSDDPDSSSDSSESDSDSSDDDSSSSDSSSAPSEQPSKPTTKSQANDIPAQREPNAPAKTTSTPTNFVPPGLGKAVTQSRNARRRRKKMYDRVAAQTEPSSVNDIPLGQRPAVPSEPPVAGPSNPTTVVPTIMMASLSNKNKRKGFKQAMANALPEKIVFDGPEATDVSAPGQATLPFFTTPAAEIKATAPNIFPRLIPPSEKQENGQLPPNMFVTSIDVEEGMHTGKNKKKGKKKAPSPVARRETMEVEELVLDYGEADDHIPTQRESIPAANTANRDWTRVEAKWDSYVKINNTEQIKAGSTVGWKALGINPTTFTPEWLVNVGEIVTVGDKVVVKPVYKPGEVAFEESEGDEELEVLYDEETYDWKADVLAGDWKLMP